MGPSYGGPFQSVRKLAQAEMEAGIDVEVMMPWSAEAEAHLGDWAPVKVSADGKIQIPPLGWSAGYGKVLKATEADILHTHGLWQHPSWAALAWKRRYGKPHVVSVRGMLEPWAWQHKAWKKRPVWWLWEQWNLQSASLLHATSEQEARSLRERGLTAPIAVIPNGVDLANAEKLKTEMLKRDPRMALYLSRIHPKKGLPLLLEAWTKVQPENWVLNIVGPDEGGHLAELKRQVTVLGLVNRIRFSDALTGDAKEAAFRNSELFILPTHSENFGIAVAEAMAHGLPVITTHGAPWKLLEEESCGWWVPVSVDGIAAALDDATRRSPEVLTAMGERGRAVVAERFAWDRIAGEMIACYEWLLGRGPRPGCVR
jgi:glycosyltransferase involved in cell wall biosynthesis